MTQNIYDDPGFFAAYGRLERSLTGLDGAPEWPALQASLPDVNGARVLDLGCGFGWFSRWASVPRRSVDPGGRRVWPIDGYSVEGSRTTDWLAPGVVKQHRTIGTYVNLLLDAGFRLTRLVEWAPTDTQIAARADLLDERARPMFLLFAAVRV